ncbi:unnamed protein product [Amoebophrya sp. A25]|nr:unnamed protein product [Amoebophrya sp. A25]|eukprot:GSA25T00017109001.1
MLIILGSKKIPPGYYTHSFPLSRAFYEAFRRFLSTECLRAWKPYVQAIT